MSIYICRQCGDKFSYCRKCVFRPIRHNELGFCSQKCYDESKKEVIPAEDVEVVITDRDTSTSE